MSKIWQAFLTKNNIIYYNSELKVFKSRKEFCIKINTRKLNFYKLKPLELNKRKNLVLG